MVVAVQQDIRNTSHSSRSAPYVWHFIAAVQLVCDNTDYVPPSKEMKYGSPEKRLGFPCDSSLMQTITAVTAGTNKPNLWLAVSVHFRE